MAKKFKKIVLTGAVSLSPPILEAIRGLSEEDFGYFPTASKDAGELIKRLNRAEAVLCGWGNSLTREVLERSPSLKYLGMCGTNVDDIDLKAAGERGIAVTHVVGYSEEGTAEFIFAYLFSFMRGLQGRQWKETPTELNGKTLGIVGMGAVGTCVTMRALSFGMKVAYFSRTRKPEIEKLGVTFVPLDELLQKCQMISLHVSRNTKVLTQREFDLIPEGTILINTSYGQIFDEEAFFKWIRRGKNFAIMDNPAAQYRPDAFQNINNILFSNVTASQTVESKERLSCKVLENLQSFLNGSPKSIVICIRRY